MTPRQRGDRSFRNASQGNSQGCEGVSPANCESFPHLIFDRIGGGRGSVCATGHCLTRANGGAGARRGVQPSAFSESRKINSRRGIPFTRAIAGAKLQSDFLVAKRN